MSGGGFSAYDLTPSSGTEFTAEGLLAVLREEKRQHRVIFAGFKRVPLSYWFMQRAKSYLLHMNVKVNEANKNVIEFCLRTKKNKETKTVMVVNSYIKKVGRRKEEYYVGSSWLSQAVHLAYNYLVTNHGCRAPLYAFVKSLDPMQGIPYDPRFIGPRKKARKIQYLENHREHLKIQEQFLYLIAQYQAAKEQREKDANQIRTNPQRLMDIEMEKMHIGLFRSYAAEMGTVYWDKPYMSTSTNTRGPARGAIGMVGSHGCPTAKELEAYKEKLRTLGPRRKKHKTKLDVPLESAQTEGVYAANPRRRRQAVVAPRRRRTPPAVTPELPPHLQGYANQQVAIQAAIAGPESDTSSSDGEPDNDETSFVDADDISSGSSSDSDSGSDSGSDADAAANLGSPPDSRNFRKTAPKISVGMVGAL